MSGGPDLRFCKLVIGNLLVRPDQRVALSRDELAAVARLARWWGVPLIKEWVTRRNCLIGIGEPRPSPRVRAAVARMAEGANGEEPLAGTSLPAEHFA